MRRRLQKAAYLPEELTVKILERLPIKSLIRFTSVSKRWRFIILSDPEFAKSQFRIASQRQTFRHRALIAPEFESTFEIESHDLLSYSPRKLRLPFIQPYAAVTLICSCNGLVCALLLPAKHLYIWNPSTNFFYKLPEPVGYPFKKPNRRLLYIYGFGYLLASDEYKLIAKLEHGHFGSLFIFSSKANIWRRMEVPVSYRNRLTVSGILSNEVLHWLYMPRPRNDAELLQNEPGIFAFDLAKEEFRKMRLPDVDDVRALGFLLAFGDSLCVFDLAKFSSSCSINMWVMQEYGVDESWMKLYKLKISNQIENITGLRPIVVHETSTFLQKRTVDSDGWNVNEVIRSGHTIEELDSFVLSWNANFMDMIEYEETLLSFAACPLNGRKAKGKWVNQRKLRILKNP